MRFGRAGVKAGVVFLRCGKLVVWSSLSAGARLCAHTGDLESESECGVLVAGGDKPRPYGRCGFLGSRATVKLLPWENGY